MVEQKIRKRKQGDVKALNIELLTHQKEMLDDYSKRLSISKADIVAQALNMWFGSVGKVN